MSATKAKKVITKAVLKKTSAKPAAKKPVAKSAAKPVKKVAPAKKPVAKKAPVKAAPAKKVTKPVAKPVKKAVAKPVAKKPALKKPVAKSAAKSTVKSVAKKPAAKPVKPVKVAKAPVKAVAKPAPVKKEAKKDVKKETKLAKVVEDKKSTAKKVKEAEAKLEVAPAIVEEPVKKTRGRKPKPVEPVDPNVDNRTDRQKARDRKAKEKALLQEFNAQKLGSEEQQELRRAKLKHLIKMGKSRGYLTHGEINDVMSDEISDADSLETLIGLLSDIGITVYEQAPDAETLLLNENAPSATTEEEAEEEAEAALSTVDSEFGRTTDPVRMYMREMGTVDLLTREGEIVIAKKIEAGLKEMVMALSACPVTIAEILDNVQKIEEGTMEIDEFVDGLVDPNAEDIPMTAVEEDDGLDDEEGDEGDDEAGGGGGGNTATAKQLEELKQLSLVKFAVIRTQFDKMRKAHEKEGYNSPAYKKAQEAIRNELMGFRLTAKSVEKLCDTMRKQVDEVWALERGLVRILVDKVGVNRTEVLNGLPKYALNLKWTSLLLKESKPYSGILERNVPAIQEIQQKLIDIQDKVVLPLPELKEVNKKMNEGEKRARAAKREMTVANLRLVISIAKKYTNRGLQLSLIHISEPTRH